METIRVATWESVPKDFTGIVETLLGTGYFREGSFHREDGPAVVYYPLSVGQGTEAWYWFGLSCTEEIVKGASERLIQLRAENPHAEYGELAMQAYVEERMELAFKSGLKKLLQLKSYLDVK